MDRFSRGPVGNSGSDNYGGLSRSSAGIQSFMAQVYGWMASGLFVTAVVSYFVAESSVLRGIARSSPWLLFAVQLGLVWILSSRAHKMPSSVATGMFMIYSAVTGIVLAPIFLIYTSSSLASVFAITAGTFGAMSIYGYSTKKDLSSWGSYLMMALIGFIIATVVNVFFLKNTGLAMALPYVGVLVFVGLTIYDTNMLRRMGEELEGNEEAIRRYSIVGALRLYLDFINLFILLLRILGNRR